jgi:hypothetical protein
MTGSSAALPPLTAGQPGELGRTPPWYWYQSAGNALLVFQLRLDVKS